ncbi:phosphoribosylaminoimidazolesuccinocarboxamide synthase [Gehongia tenuis]|uniref:Phosphoribosylaminoimidazole-succinocarboxamide synthase n=1 Tax=Gehongia tenuis TaxID=2763655 RepID=A0A926D4J3_9FIRM|nr:phosphoribosylaminoimidazolesuccinocarboxamide synthase [Gehongia tenuis]MBC8531309.1 phosphoribosylaminoimidazolesuccinocarboxamide synthase [Gehongia tenuis]
MKETQQMYEGKAKKVFATEDEKYVIVNYKDDATAFNGKKKGTIASKGVINNRMSNYLFQMLEKNGVETHFVEELDERRTVVKKVEIVPVEVIVRNIAAGGICKRLGLTEGMKLCAPVVEYCYKSDELDDPMINDDHIKVMDLATEEEMKTIREMTLKINGLLQERLLKADLILVDFKLEFGRFDGKIILADEISPDTCRLWDVHTMAKLDKDRFRRDLGDVEEAYQEVMRRLMESDNK